MTAGEPGRRCVDSGPRHHPHDLPSCSCGDIVSLEHSQTREQPLARAVNQREHMKKANHTKKLSLSTEAVRHLRTGELIHVDGGRDTGFCLTYRCATTQTACGGPHTIA